MNGNSGARLMYLLTHAPSDDRVGRCAAPDTGSAAGIVGGPAFEMPDTAPAVPSSARGSVRTWSAPADPALTADQQRWQRPTAPAVHVEQRPAVELQPPAAPAADVTAPAGDVEPHSIGQAFVTAGRAVFTLQGAEARYTFKVTKREPTDQYPRPAYFVSLLTGPDNTADYTYVGLLDVATGQVRPTAKSSYKPESKPVLAFNWVMRRLWAGKDPAPAKVYHEGRCGRCGRALTVPSSIESGFGPECLGKLGE